MRKFSEISGMIKDQGSRIKDQGSRIKDQGSVGHYENALDFCGTLNKYKIGVFFWKKLFSKNS